MGVVLDMSRAQIEFQVADGDPGRFLVSRYRGTEGLCRLYRFEIELVSHAPDFSFDDYVGLPAALTVRSPAGERRFHGIIAHFEMTGETVNQTYFRAELVPSVWMLTHRYGSRIFQKKSIPEIIRDVLKRGGIPADRFRLDLQRSYPARDYCVQYRETDYNFICRLMEEEGIWWYFEQSDDGDVLVAADSPAHPAPIDGDGVMPYRPPSGMNVDEEHVFRFRLGRSVRSGAVTLRDFNFQNPRLQLHSRFDAGRDGDLEVSDYPGEYEGQARGAELSQIRTEEFDAGRTLGLGQSNSHRLSPGRTLELIDHPQEALNVRYLLTSVTHQGKQATTRSTTGTNGRLHVIDAGLHQSLLAVRQGEDPAARELAEGLLRIASSMRVGDPTSHRALTSWLYHGGQVSANPAAAAGACGGSPLEALAIPNLIEDAAPSSLVDFDAPTYECRFECIPASVTYRPPRITPWPVMRGTQTARVVGPQNEEIYTDEYGRVKVQFHWDREGRFDENSSCWIRVSQGMAGGQYGMMFLPRVGQEVVVDFLEGNPDQPLITGRVYNGDHMPPYPLPAERTKSCIKTHSSTGGGGTNEIRFEDLKDNEQLLFHAQKDLHVRVKNDRVEAIERDHHLRVERNQCELVKQNKSGEVRLDLSEKVGGRKSLLVAGDVGEDFRGNHSEAVGGSYFVKAKQGIVLEAGEELTIKVGGNFIKLDKQTISVLGKIVNINSGGAAGVGSPVALKSPLEALIADGAAPGRDTRYAGGEEPPDPSDEDRKKKPSWIEIELVDELGRPVPHERYEIIAPDGRTIREGTLDENGLAYESVPDPGLCQISFPNLDSAAWDRAGSTQPAGAAQAPSASNAKGGSPKSKPKPHKAPGSVVETVKNAVKDSPVVGAVSDVVKRVIDGPPKPKEEKPQNPIVDGAKRALEDSKTSKGSNAPATSPGGEDGMPKFIRDEVERRRKEGIPADEPIGSIPHDPISQDPKGPAPAPASTEGMPKFIRDEIERRKKEGTSN